MDTQSWLEGWLTQNGGVAGTVHRRDGDVLVLAASVRIPPPVIAATRVIPNGKGMAGLAWRHGAPIQTCNLKEDETGTVKPGARAVDAKAAIAIPVFDGDGAVRAVVGIAFLEEGELPADRVAALAEQAARLP
jgi:L-methionine (R)-S-oxide reductase